jgi:hypothetical protein
MEKNIIYLEHMMSDEIKEAHLIVDSEGVLSDLRELGVDIYADYTSIESRINEKSPIGEYYILEFGSGNEIESEIVIEVEDKMIPNHVVNKLKHSCDDADLSVTTTNFRFEDKYSNILKNKDYVNMFRITLNSNRSKSINERIFDMMTRYFNFLSDLKVVKECP